MPPAPVVPFRASAAPNFPRERMEMIREVEAGHYWFQPREKLLQRTLAVHQRPPAVVLDVGCGSGQWSRRLQSAGYRVCGTDIWREPPPGLAADEYATGVAAALQHNISLPHPKKPHSESSHLNRSHLHHQMLP